MFKTPAQLNWALTRARGALVIGVRLVSRERVQNFGCADQGGKRADNEEASTKKQTELAARLAP